jgi:hypothetical protein
VKRVGDTTFELELYPKLVYIGKINSAGEKPFRKLIVD